MKVLYHHRTKSRDGQAVHIRALIAALRARGHAVEEWALSRGEQGAIGSEGGSAGRWLRIEPKAGVRRAARIGSRVLARAPTLAAENIVGLADCLRFERRRQ